MTSKRVALVVLQALGGVSLLIYPGVLVAGVMSLAAQGEGPGVLAFKAAVLASLAYPLLWLALWVASWVLLGRRPRLALILSGLPAIATLAIGFLLVGSSFLGGRSVARYLDEDVARVRSENPLAAEILAASHAPHGGGDLLAAVDAADVALLSKPVSSYCTPLKLAVRSSQLESSLDLSRARAPFVDVARRLLTRGARLSAEEERDDAAVVWLVNVLRRGASLPDPAAQRENAYVWEIMGAGPHDGPRLSSRAYDVDPALLSAPTRTYGTPLRAAFLRNFRGVAYTLVSKGVVPSPAELEDVAFRGQLEAMVKADFAAEAAAAYLARLKAGGEQR